MSALLEWVIAQEAQRLVRSWSAAHVDQPDGVHLMRVSARRLRSTLATGRPFLDRDLTEPLRDELGWLADVLGVARDAEVQLVRVDEAVDTLVTERADVDWEADHVRPALLAPLHDQLGRAIRDVRAALEGPRYATLTARLEQLVLDPPWTDKAHKRVHGPYRRKVERLLLRLDRRMRAATDSGLDPEARAEALHDARKAVKRTRYAVQPLLPIYPGRAKKLLKRLKSLQAALGQLQDTVISREYLHDLVASHPQELDATVGLVAGALIEREARHAAEYEHAAMVAWRRLMDCKPLG